MAEQRPDFSERERPVAAPLSDNQSEPPTPEKGLPTTSRDGGPGVREERKRRPWLGIEV